MRQLAIAGFRVIGHQTHPLQCTMNQTPQARARPAKKQKQDSPKSRAGSPEGTVRSPPSLASPTSHGQKLVIRISVPPSPSATLREKMGAKYGLLALPFDSSRAEENGAWETYAEAREAQDRAGTPIDHHSHDGSIASESLDEEIPWIRIDETALVLSFPPDLASSIHASLRSFLTASVSPDLSSAILRNTDIRIISQSWHAGMCTQAELETTIWSPFTLPSGLQLSLSFRHGLRHLEFQVSVRTVPGVSESITLLSNRYLDPPSLGSYALDKEAWTRVESREFPGFSKQCVAILRDAVFDSAAPTISDAQLLRLLLTVLNALEFSKIGSTDPEWIERALSSFKKRGIASPSDTKPGKTEWARRALSLVGIDADPSKLWDRLEKGLTVDGGSA